MIYVNMKNITIMRFVKRNVAVPQIISSPVRGSTEHTCFTQLTTREQNELWNNFIENVRISVIRHRRIMSLLESEVVSVLETLVKTTVNEMAKVIDSSGIPPQTTADKSVALDFTVSVVKVHEMTGFLSCCVCFKL